MENSIAHRGYAVDIAGLEKSYGAFAALKGVDFRLREGEVHALMGQNGAGKSTLIKVLAGAEPASAGVIKIFGAEKTFSSPADAAAAGVSVVYQDLSLVPGMTVADNLFLGREPIGLGGAIRRKEIRERTKQLLDRYGFPIDPVATVDSLPFAYKQMTEIAKALLRDAKVLILDEPTSALTENEEEILFAAVRNVISRGVSVIYVTHRLNEVFKICQRVTVFRDGRSEGTSDVKDLDMKALVASIIGPEIDRKPGHSANGSHRLVARGKLAQQFANQSPAIELKSVSSDKLSGIDLVVRRGEVVGLAGPLGSGRTEILETIFGLRQIVDGSLVVDGKPHRFRNVADAISAGIGLVPEDRHEEGLVLDHSIEHNLALTSLKRLTRFGWFLRNRSKKRADGTIGELSIKAPSSRVVLSALSGGNQQKVVFGKWGNPRCSVMLLDEPTVGVDVGARDEIYREINKAVEQGSGVLVVSSDLAELLLLCDRFYVVNNGTITDSFDRNMVDSEQELHHKVHTAPSDNKE